MVHSRDEDAWSEFESALFVAAGDLEVVVDDGYALTGSDSLEINLAAEIAADEALQFVEDLWSRDYELLTIYRKENSTLDLLSREQELDLRLLTKMRRISNRMQSRSGWRPSPKHCAMLSRPLGNSTATQTARLQLKTSCSVSHFRAHSWSRCVKAPRRQSAMTPHGSRCRAGWTGCSRHGDR
jgi:hypothetical protein